nr:hypothetical protein KitaXyl93_51740 [Kitasatospora sp. Xyl93]
MPMPRLVYGRPGAATPRVVVATKFCTDAHGKAAARARKATEAVTRSRPTPTGPTGDRYPALRAIWDAVAAQVATEGVMVAGSSGVPVAHPLLRFLGQLDTSLSAHERASEAASEADPHRGGPGCRPDCHGGLPP